MKNKKVFSVLISFTMLVLVCCSPFIAYASFFVAEGDIISCPGNMRAYTKAEDYNYAWLDSLIVRDGSLAVTPLTVYPVSDYPYSLTCSEFVEECNNYMLLFEASDDAVQSSVIDSLKTIYYTLVATGVITDSNQNMRAYNESNGIVYPFTESKFTDLYTAITYACLKNNLHKLVGDEDIEIPRGTTVEGAVVRFLCAVCKMVVPSNAETIPAFSYLFAEKYVLEDSKYPVSENPSEQEVYYWVKLQAAEKCGYDVPSTTRFDDLSSEQIDYVNYAYFATILTTKYGTPVNPLLLKAALLSSEPSKEVPKLVLRSMLDFVSAPYSSSDSMQNLFDKAAKEGFFDLDNEFYTDIFNYKIYVPADCEKVWITCFPIADQLDDGSNDDVITYVNGSLVKNSSTNAVPVSPEGTTFTVKTAYAGKSDTATYVFTVIRTQDAQSFNEAPSVDLSDPLENIAANVSNIVAGAVGTAEQNTLPSEGYTFSTPITTYSVDEYTDGKNSGSFIETYPVDEGGKPLENSDPLELTPEEETSVSVLSNVADTVRENPVVVAAPAGLLAVGASAGFMFYRRRKDGTDSDATEE